MHTSQLRAAIRGLIILTLLAWATQTLLSQLALGQELEDRFMPSAGSIRAARVELKSQCTVEGTSAKLRDIARWSEADAVSLAFAGDVVIARVTGEEPATIDIDDVKNTLEAAGVNLGLIQFSGAAACHVTQANRATAPAMQADRSLSPEMAARSSLPESSRRLRDVLIEDLSRQLGVPADLLQIRFRPQDEKVASACETSGRFEVEPQVIRRLGEITWNVNLANGEEKQRTSITGHVRMWQDQLITARPLAAKQPIASDDVSERRVLVDRLGEETPLKKEQVIGQQAARDVGPGTILSGRMIEAAQAVRLGQLVTVSVEMGRVYVKWVAEARESGAVGQTIRVRKPASRDEFSILLTGPQQGRLIGSADEAAAKVAAR